jgi:hypothetical protein
VAAYVVVIVENENARIRLPGAIKMCSREPADAAAYDDQIIVFAGRCDRPGARPETGLAQRMRGLEAARMAATQPSQRRRIIAGGILCRGFPRSRRSGERGRNQAARRSPDGERYAIQKISSRDAFCSRRNLDRKAGVTSPAPSATNMGSIGNVYARTT